MSIHCQAMSDWFELSIRHSVIYDEIIMTYPIHGWSPLCSTSNSQVAILWLLAFFLCIVITIIFFLIKFALLI